MTTSPDPQDGNWHLDKKVPLAIILVLVLQTGSIAWWAGTIQGRVEDHTQSIRTILEDQRRDQTARNLQAIQLGRIEEQMLGVRSDLSRILNMFDIDRSR